MTRCEGGRPVAARRLVWGLAISVASIGAGQAGAQTEVQPDKVLRERFEEKAERAEYQVTMVAGEILNLRVVGLGDDDLCKYAITLHGQAGQVLRQSNVANGIRFPPGNRAEIRGFKVPADGCNTFAVENHGEPSTYRLEVGFVGLDIEPGKAYDARLDAKDRDEYRITLKAGDRLWLEAEGPEGSHLIARVLGKDQTTIIRQSNVANGIGFPPGRQALIDNLAIPDDGAYLIQVANDGATVTPYHLRVGALLSDGKRIPPPPKQARGRARGSF